MKKTNIYLRTAIALLLLFSLSIGARSRSQKSSTEYSPVVESLKMMYDTNAVFKSTIDNALKSAISPLDGWSADPQDPSKLYIWSEKSIEDLLQFFEDWRTFVPSPENGMMYYELLYGLCYENSSALKFVSTEPGLSWTKQFVDARGDFMDSPASIDKNIMEKWKSSMGESWSDYIAPHDKSEGFEGFTTFNEFFTRNLAEGVRPISDSTDARTLAAPADGVVNIINENLNTDSRIHTKYKEYLNVSQLLAGSEYAERFIGGTATSTVLLPDNYHHYHSPVKGTVVETKDVNAEDGVYFGMDGQFFTYLNNGNVGGYMSDYGVFGIYHRGYYIIETEHFGYIAMIPVGLDDISSINFEKKFSPDVVAAKGAVSVNKGERVGHFAYGGSTVILLFEPGVLQAVKLKQGAQMSIISAIK